MFTTTVFFIDGVTNFGTEKQQIFTFQKGWLEPVFLKKIRKSDGYLFRPFKIV